ncbi:MAG: hypothetical protein KJO31_05505 [Gammaproteobacteria bacterium]|nr:hypothetical protein [Gammaproteobacteria bacterium]
MKKKMRFGVALATAAALLVSAGNASADHRYKRLKERAVTNWLVIVNYPEACSSSPCSEADIFGAIPANPTKATVCYLTGQVVGKKGDAVFAGRIGEGTAHGCFFPEDPNPHGLKDSMRAEIHVIVQQHGKPLELGYGLEDQVTLNFGGCNPDCEDVQFAIHVPGTDIDGRSYSALYRFADGSEVYGAKSLLIRDREGVRVITDTTLDPYYH